MGGSKDQECVSCSFWSLTVALTFLLPLLLVLLILFFILLLLFLLLLLFCTGFVRTLCALYATCLLSLLMRVEVNVLGRYLYVDNEQGNKAAEASKLEGEEVRFVSTQSFPLLSHSCYQCFVIFCVIPPFTLPAFGSCVVLVCLSPFSLSYSVRHSF